ncbi:hypothetical protein [Cellulophaga omnivescoria]|uniref:hypothetical protein n=1 Tax=Cellulophaga omnivescoria TaxID=1888890 RepID=UPI0009873050|nr:hypothetical protein [Cellulophaga omnivescoria]
MNKKTIFLICGIITGIAFLNSISGYLFDDSLEIKWGQNLMFFSFAVFSFFYYFKLKKSE